MLEILLLSACLHNVACPEVSTAYYEYRSDLREGVKEFEARIRRRYDERIFEYGIPALLIAGQADGAINLGYGAALTYKPKTGDVGLKLGLSY